MTPRVRSFPMFPLRARYMADNYTVEGVDRAIEGRARPGEIPAPESHVPPAPTDGQAAALSEEAVWQPAPMPGEADQPRSPEWKFGADGRRLLVDEAGYPIRRPGKWRPHHIPLKLWRSSPEMRGTWRERFPDPLQGYLAGPSKLTR